MKEKISKKRIIGAAFFGFIVGYYLNSAFEYTLPRIFSIVKKVSIEEGYMIYADSVILSLILSILAIFFAGMVAGFLARQKGILIGLLANSISIILFGGVFILAIFWGEDVFIGHISAQLYAFIGFSLAILASIFGGYFGQKFYSPENDLDLRQTKLTVFGIRWFHYFWILPFIIYSFLATFIIAVYAGVLVALADLYFVIHPSLWLKISWWGFLFFMPVLGMIAIYILGFAFVRFWELMQYRQTKSKGWGRFGKILLYGIGAPILASVIAYFVANVAHNMPKPATGDWKIGLCLLGIIPTITLVVYIFSWIKNRFSKNKNNL